MADANERLFAGKYRLIGELGRGGMGVVMRAEDVRLKRPVALKFLCTDLAASADLRARFLPEAQAVAALDSPYICTVYEAGESDGNAYIAMALIEGPTLEQRLAAGPLSVEDVITFARQMAGARRGVVTLVGCRAIASELPFSNPSELVRDAAPHGRGRRIIHGASSEALADRIDGPVCA